MYITFIKLIKICTYALLSLEFHIGIIQAYKIRYFIYVKKLKMITIKNQIS